MVSPSESGSSKLERAKNDTKPKDGTWVANIDDKITADVRHLLENYSKVPPHDVVKHVYDIVSGYHLRIILAHTVCPVAREGVGNPSLALYW